MNHAPVTSRRRAARRPSVGLRAAGTLAALLLAATSTAAEPRHGISVFGDLKYGPDFERFDYTSPDAVKGGSVVQGTIGTFDNTNPFVLKGVPAVGAAGIYDTLAVGSLDEPFSVYGLLAESIEVADDKGSVTFRLRPEARFHDGEPVTADDVVWTFDTLMKEGHPFYRSYYGAVDRAEALDGRTVKFTFKETGNAELPLIVSQLAVLPKHFWEGREFGRTTLDPLLGSGPYRFGRIDAGRSVSYERVDDYWAKDLPVERGSNNFDTLRYDYYRDLTVALEALKSGDVDFRQEFVSKDWATGYDFPALQEGRVVREEIPDGRTQPMQAFVFNLRKPKYRDERVRRALEYTFDFEWANENLFYGSYERTLSFFQNSAMQATGLPEGRELEILEPFRDELPGSVFTEEFALPVTDGSGRDRLGLREALKLFKEAGYEVRDRTMTNVASGEPFDMEMIIGQPQVERLGLAWKKVLERLGIDLKVRVIDSAQYQKRTDDFDFDVTTDIWQQSESPGNEQRDYWGSAQADVPGSRNLPGIEDPVVDAIIPLIVDAASREELVAAAKALDRVLLHRHYVLPQYFGATYRVAYANKFDRPATAPTKALGLETWWVDPEKEAALKN